MISLPKYSAVLLRCLCVLALCCLLPQAFAATARIQIPEGELFLGQRFTFYLIVDGEKSVPEPDIPEDSDLNIRLVGSAPSETDTGHRVAFTYEAVPLRPGQLFIPGFELQTGSDYLEIEPTSLRIQSPESTDQMALEVSLSHQTCYVGEPIVLSFVWRSQLSLNGISALDLRVPALVDSQIKVHEPHDAPAPNDKAAIGLPVENRRVIARFVDVTESDPPTALITFEKILVPQSSGPLILPASTLLCSYTEPKDSRFKGARYPSYFNNDFFDTESSGADQRLLISSPSINLQVLDLPPAGRPEHFDGIIGAFQLTASAEPTIATTSEPITLTLKASGHPYPQIFDLPPLNTRAALPLSFQIPEDRAAGKLEGDILTFRQTLRALRPKVPEIPAIQFSYFDPTTGRYGQAKTPPIPVTITQAEQVSAFDAQFSDGTALRNIVTPKPGGIHHNRSGTHLLKSVLPPGSPLRSKGFWILLLALPPLLLTGFAFWYREQEQQRADPAAARARHAHRNFRKALGKGSDETQAACDYLCDRLHLQRGTAAPQELTEGLAARGVEEPQLTNYLISEDHQPYTSEPNDSTPTRPDLPALIAQIERSLNQ